MKKGWILATAGVALAGLAAWAIRSTKEESGQSAPLCDCEENAAPTPLDRQETKPEADEDIYYWAQKGGVWHSVSNCGYLAHTDNVQSGTLEQARQAGKKRACSSCAL